MWKETSFRWKTLLIQYSQDWSNTDTIFPDWNLRAKLTRERKKQNHYHDDDEDDYEEDDYEDDDEDDDDEDDDDEDDEDDEHEDEDEVIKVIL